MKQNLILETVAESAMKQIHQQQAFFRNFHDLNETGGETKTLQGVSRSSFFMKHIKPLCRARPFRSHLQ